jgi:hypothetical protein
MTTREAPRPPREALSPDHLQRFMYACSHERHAPTTQRLIDASTYGWIHLFIRDHGEEGGAAETGEGWLDPRDADPAKLAAYFGRVAIRVGDTGAHDYAISLQNHFDAVAEELQPPWPSP